MSLPLLPLVAFAWYSRQRDGVGYHLIEKPWHAKMPFKTAVAETRGWLERVIVEYCLEKRPGNGDWHKVSRACGYRFLPMRTPQELAEEGARMQNCVASYAYRVGIGACLIYSVRRGGTRVATLEVAPDPGQPLAARIAQLRGPANSPPADDVVRVAEAWLMRRGRYPIAIRRHLANLPIVPGSWQAIWRPFCAARPQFASTLLDSHTQGLLRLYTDLRKLEAFEEAR